MILSTRRPVKLPNTILKSALGLNSLWPNHAIERLRSWSPHIQVMASCKMEPSHYLKQCGLIIKLINKVLWHLSQWVIMNDLKIPISKMRLKLICWDNFTPNPEIVNLLSSDNSFVCHGGEQIIIVTISNPSSLCLSTQGEQGTLPMVFCDHTTGGNLPRT